MNRLVFLAGNAIRLAQAPRVRQKDARLKNGVEAPRWSREAKLSCLWLQVQVVTSVNTDYCSFVLVYLVKLLANVSSSSQLLQNYQNDNYYCKE